MPIQVLLPAPLKRERERPAAQVHARKPLPPAPVLGLIDNGKTKAAEILDSIGRRMVERGVVADYFVWQKASAGRTIDVNEQAAMLARAHVIISGIGD